MLGFEPSTLHMLSTHRATQSAHQLESVVVVVIVIIIVSWHGSYCYFQQVLEEFIYFYIQIISHRHSCTAG